ncbi:MAG TPA: hypothetical protein VJ837_01785 [Candidatus Paceibacterota bacterium]|nr:hypothetical protein [Candidatus Paceibacterota bacterium]
MPTLHSHRNTNVSKVWFVVLSSFIVMVSVVWNLFTSLQEIAFRMTATSDQINELMEDPR